MLTDRLLTQLAALEDETATEAAPARLKSRIYSALMSRQAEGGPLRSLTTCEEDSGQLCVFERSVALLRNEDLSSRNPCRVCHARVLGERLKWAPIFWPGCPYSEFHNP